jgi:hypothetical protein
MYRVVKEACHEQSGEGPKHEHPRQDLHPQTRLADHHAVVLEEEPHCDRQAEHEECRLPHLFQGRLGYDADTAGVIRLVLVRHDAGLFPELPPNFLDHRLCVEKARIRVRTALKQR